MLSRLLLLLAVGLAALSLGAPVPEVPVPEVAEIQPDARKRPAEGTAPAAAPQAAATKGQACVRITPRDGRGRAKYVLQLADGQAEPGEPWRVVAGSQARRGWSVYGVCSTENEVQVPWF